MHLFREGKDVARNICVYLWCEVFIPFPIKNMATALRAKFTLCKFWPQYFPSKTEERWKACFHQWQLILFQPIRWCLLSRWRRGQLEDQIGRVSGDLQIVCFSAEVQMACFTDLLAIKSPSDVKNKKQNVFLTTMSYTEDKYSVLNTVHTNQPLMHLWGYLRLCSHSQGEVTHIRLLASACCLCMYMCSLSAVTISHYQQGGRKIPSVCGWNVNNRAVHQMDRLLSCEAKSHNYGKSTSIFPWWKTTSALTQMSRSDVFVDTCHL